MITPLSHQSGQASNAGVPTRRGDAILKQTDPRSGTLEVAVTRAAHQLACESDAFYVPEVLDWQPHSGVLSLEYVPNLQPLSACLNQPGPATTLVHRLGRVLGLVHTRLDLPPDVALPAPAPWSAEPPDQVVVHGDFNLTNICLQPETDRLVLLDWSTGPALPFVCTHASRYLDLVNIVRCLFLQQPRLIRAARHFNIRRQALLEGYQNAVKRDVDPAQLGTFLCRLGRCITLKQIRQHKLRSLARGLLAWPWLMAGTGRPTPSTQATRPDKPSAEQHGLYVYQEKH